MVASVAFNRVAAVQAADLIAQDEEVTVADKLRALANSFQTLGIRIQTGRVHDGLLVPFVENKDKLKGVQIDDLTFLYDIQRVKGIDYVKGFTSVAYDVCDKLSRYSQVKKPDIYREIGLAIAQHCCDSDIAYYGVQALEYLPPLVEKVIALK